MSIIPTLLFLLLILVQTQCAEEKSYSELKGCDVGPLAAEIASYETVVKNIIDYTVNGPFKGRTYKELAKFVDKYGPRIAGSDILEKAIDHVSFLSKDEMVTEVITNYVEVPYWQRFEEKLNMLEPIKKKLAVLGLGLSVPTPPEGITAEVIVISNFTVLENTPDDQIKGKIVVYDQKFTTYGKTVQYRLHGAAKAAEKGAVAALVRSVTPFSLNTPHTGYLIYPSNVTKIPSAAITLEEADLMRRMSDRGEKIVLHLKMNSTTKNRISRNTLVDMRGTHDTEKVVVISAHIDSWDVGHGAIDDGGGVFLTWAATVILKQLELSAKRKIRAIYWTGEELGYIGAQAYASAHSSNTDNIDFIMEADEGTFAPLGLVVGGNQQARCIIAEVLKLFKSINASTLIEEESPGSDIAVFTKQGIPGAMLHNANEKYFWYQHSEADTMNVLNSDDLDLGAAFWTAVAYVIADLSVDIPQDDRK